jgi:hypothetical protein
VLAGGPGTDWVSYEDRTAPLTINLADPGPDAGDTLLGIENVHGGRGDDRLSGDDGPNISTTRAAGTRCSVAAATTSSAPLYQAPSRAVRAATTFAT